MDSSEDKPVSLAHIYSQVKQLGHSNCKEFLKVNDIKISTITLDCKLGVKIDLAALSHNLVLKMDEIVSIKFGDRNNPATNRTIVHLVSKKKPSKRAFYNQVTILMKPMNNQERKHINIKVFKNGSLQMTGCKDMDDFYNVTTTLIRVLKRGQDVRVREVVNEKGKKIVKKSIKHYDYIVDYAENHDKIHIHESNVRMINSNFKLDYRVDRKKLHKLLEKNHGNREDTSKLGYIEYKYKPSGGHSCVNIKYPYDARNKPSVFVFQTGSIIITGAKTLPQIIMAYYFINKLLDMYYHEIRIIHIEVKRFEKEMVRYRKKIRNI